MSDDYEPRKCAICGDFTVNVWTAHCSQECLIKDLNKEIPTSMQPFERLRALKDENEKLNKSLESAQEWARDAALFLASMSISQYFHDQNKEWCNRILNRWNNAKGNIKDL